MVDSSGPKKYFLFLLLLISVELFSPKKEKRQTLSESLASVRSANSKVE